MNSYQRANLAGQIVSSLIMVRSKSPSVNEDDFKLELVKEAFQYIDNIDKINSDNRFILCRASL